MPRPPAAAQRAGSASTKSTRSTKSRRELATGASSSERVRGRRQHRSEPRKEEAKKPHRQQQRPPFTLEFTEAARSPSPRGRRHGTASQSPSRHTLQKAADSDVWKLRVPSKEWLEKYGLGKLALPFEHHLSRRHKAKLERRRNRLPQRHGAPSSDDSDSDDDRDTGDDDADETGAAKRTHVHGGKAEAESEDKLDEDELAALHVSDLKEAHAKTTACRQLVQQRLDWLLEGSRAHFGALTGVQTAIIIADDHSDKRRLVDLLCELLEDQVLLHPSMQWIRATASAAIHHFMPDTKESSLNQVFNWLQQQAPFAPALTGQEARKSVASLTPAQTRAHQSATFSSLLKGLTIRSRSSSPHGISAGYREDGIDVCRAVDAALDHHPRPRRIHLILGSPPRRSDEQVLDHVRRALARAGQHVRLDVVCTHAQNRRLLQLAHQLAKVGRGRRHVLNVESGELWSDDVRAVQRHLTRATKTERAVETALKEAVRIAHVQQLAEDDRRRETKQRTQPRRGGGGGGRRREAGGRANKGWIVGDTRSSRLRMKQRDGDRTHDKPTTATRRVRRDKRDLSRVPAHDVPPHLLGSTRWLHKYGLDVRGLSPYTVFADVAYTCSKPGLYIGREYKTMCKVMWTDGAERTVHIDPARVLILRRQIAVAKDLYTRRLNWLGTGSRRLFPSMQESVVTIVVEANAKTQKSWPLLLAHIKAALQEQVVHRSHFNVVLYGAHAHKFSPDVVPASKSSIRHAWEWIKYFDIEDSKANNIYDAAKAAIDNLRPQRHGTEHGIYWVTASGNSQKSEPTIAYIREILAEGHTHMHMLSYNAHHVERTRELHQQLAEAGGGRYQFVHEEGTALDEAHRQDKSWTATQEAVAAIAAKFKTKDSAESRALWKKARNAHITQNPGSIAELHGPPTLSLDSLRKQQYAVLSTWMHQRTRTALHDALRSDALDESGSAEVVCKSCGTDTLLLQQEIARADEYVSVLDGMLTALPAEYALAAFKTAEKRGETVPAHIAEELRRRRQEEVQQQLDREQRNSADDDDGRGGAGSSADEGGGSARSEGMRSETGKDSRLAQARTQTTTTIPNTGGTNRGGGRSERTQQLSTAAGGGAGGRARAKTLRHGVPAHVPLTRSTQLRQQQLERRKKNNEKGAGDAVRPFTARSAPHTRGHRSAATTAENSTSSSSGIGCGSSRRANSAGTKKRAVAKQHSSSDSARSRRYMLINTPAEMTGPQRGPAVPADAGDNVTVPGLAKAPVDMPCTSKKWLAKCSLKKLRLTMDAFLATNSLLHEEQHVSTLARNVQGEFGSLFPVKTHTNIKSKKNAGACWYVMAKPQEFSEYLSKLSRVLTHYEQRLAWLTDGYRRVFGHFQCKRLWMAVDTSGSMHDALPLLKAAFSHLIDEHVASKCETIGLTAFGDTAESLTPDSLVVDDVACGAAVRWMNARRAHGGSALLPVLDAALARTDVNALLLISDGVLEDIPDHLLDTINKHREKHKIKIHAVLYNADATDRTTPAVLRSMAAVTNGSYHEYTADFAQLKTEWIEHCMSTPEAEGNDGGGMDGPAHLAWLQQRFASGRVPGEHITSDDIKLLEKEIRAVKICMRRAHELKEAVASSVGRKQEPVDSDDSTDGKQQQQQLQRQKKSTGGQSCDTTTASTAATEGLDADMRRLLRLRDRARAAGARRLRDDDEEDDGDDDGDDDDDDDDDDGDDDGDGDDDDDDDGDGDDNNDSAVLSRQMTRTPRSTRSTQLRRMVTELRYKEEGEEEGNEHERRGGRTAGRNQAPSDGDDQDSDSGDDDGDGDDRHADERAWEHEGHLIDDDAGLNYNDIMRAVGRRAASSPPHHHRHADAESDAGSVDTSRLHSHNRTVRLLAGAMSDADIDDVVSDDDDDDDDRHGVHNRERRHNRATARPRPHNSRRHRPAGSVVLSNVPRLATEEDIVAMFRRRHLKPPFKVVIPWDDQREENVGTAYCFFHLLHDVTRAAQAKRLHLQGQTIFVAKRASKQDMLPHTSKALSESLLTVGSKAIHQHWFASSLASSSATL